MTRQTPKRRSNSICPHVGRCQKFTMFLGFLVVWVVVLTPFDSVRAGRRVELSFDDEIDGCLTEIAARGHNSLLCRLADLQDCQHVHQLPLEC